MRVPLALISFGLLASTSALAGDLREPVLTLLSGIEDPPSAESFAPLGQGVEAELLEIAQDGEVSRSKRARAVHALGWYPSAATQGYLEQMLGSNDRLMARKAAYALANGWADGAVPVLSLALQDQDVQLRVAAARALDSIDSAASRAALVERLAQETNATVQSTIQTALAD